MDKPSRMFQLSRLKVCREGMGEGGGGGGGSRGARGGWGDLFCE